MNRCVILYRVGSSGRVDAVRSIDVDGGDFICEFANAHEALIFAGQNALFASGQASWQIVELDEL